SPLFFCPVEHPRRALASVVRSRAPTRGSRCGLFPRALPTPVRCREAGTLPGQCLPGLLQTPRQPPTQGALLRVSTAPALLEAKCSGERYPDAPNPGKPIGDIPGVLSGEKETGGMWKTGLGRMPA